MTWTALGTTLAELASQLTSAGVPASTDRAGLPVPGAWVRCDSVTPENLLSGGSLGTAHCSVLLVVADTGDATALTALGRLLDKALTVLDPDDDVDTSVVLPLPGGNALPAWRVPVDIYL